MTACPTTLELEEALDATVDDPRRRDLEHHATTCSLCAAKLAEAREDDDLARDLVRALGGTSTPFTQDAAPSSELGTSLAGFRFLRRLGTGGMGVVWEALQDHPRRRVALKLMKSGMSGARARRRFAEEVRLLARLDHPGIARILQADTYPVDGEERPYVVLELVEGRTLDRWVREEQPALGTRLEVFVRLCEAVQHAHQKGVVHRDLKAGNVMVDARGEPRVLDFGIARSLDAAQEDPAATRTEVGQFVGTLACIAPERLAGDVEALDTRVDVYGLGGLFVELLAGEPPHDLEGLALPDALDRIRHGVPAALRTRAGCVAGVDRDLETIAATALDVDPERRYASAEALGADVRRFLAHEPIQARPARRGYVLRRFVRRHRALVACSCAGLAALVLGFGATCMQRDRALRSERAATERGHALARQTAALETEQARLENVVSFLVELLGSENPEASGRASTFTVRAALDEAAGRLDAGRIEDPRVEATLRVTLGGAYRALGASERAAPHLERGVALRREHEPGSSELAQALNALGALRWAQGRGPEAAEAWREALSIYAERAAPEDRPRRAATLSNLAVLILTEGDLGEAERLAREALQEHEAHFGSAGGHAVANDLALLANVVGLRGDRDEAERLLHQALEEHARAANPETLYTATTHWLLGSLYVAGERFEDAARAFERALRMREVLLGPDHPDVRATRADLERALERL